MKKRIYWVDIARALGMFFIILGHSLGQLSFSTFGSMIFMVNVTIFFVLSGYLFKEKPFMIQNEKLIYNVFIPYVGTAVIIIIISIYVNLFGGGHLFHSLGDFKTIFKSILFGAGTNSKLIFTNTSIPAIGAIWFLLAFYISNIIFNLYNKVLKGNLIFVGIITFLTALLGFYLTKFGILPWSINAAMLGTFFMWFGLFLKKYDMLVKHSSFIFLIVGLLLWISCSAAGYFWFNIAYADNILFALIGALGGSIVIIIFSMYVEKFLTTNNFVNILNSLTWFGKVSLTVLCVHTIEIMTFNGAGFISSHMVDQSNILRVVFEVSYRLVVVLAGVLIFDKIPFIKSVYSNRSHPFNWQKK